MNPNGISTQLDNKTDESGYERSATRTTRIGPPPRAKPQQHMTIDEAWKARAAKYLGKKPSFTAAPPEWAILHNGPSLGEGVPTDSPGWTQHKGDDVCTYGGDNNTMDCSSVFPEFQKMPQAAAAAAAAAPTNVVAATAGAATAGAATAGAATAGAATPCDDNPSNNKLLPNGDLDLRQVLTNPGYPYTREEINDQMKKLIKAAQEAYFVPQNQADFDPNESRT